MLTLILSFLKTHWQTTLITSLFFSVVAAFSLQRFEIDHLKGRLAECKGENITLENSNRALIVSIGDQNAAIVSLQMAVKHNRITAAHAYAAAQAYAVFYHRRADAIKGQPESQDDCTGLRKLVDDFVSNPGR